MAYHDWFASPERPVSDVSAPFVLPEYLKMALSKSVMRNVAWFRIRGHGVIVLYGRSPDRSARVCNLCENGDYIQDEKHFMYRTKHLRHHFIHLFDNISEGDIKGFIFNITQKFTNLLVQLSIFLIYLFVGTYMSSHCGGITPCIE